MDTATATLPPPSQVAATANSQSATTNVHHPLTPPPPPPNNNKNNDNVKENVNVNDLNRQNIEQCINSECSEDIIPIRSQMTESNGSKSRCMMSLVDVERCSMWLIDTLSLDNNVEVYLKNVSKMVRFDNNTMKKMFLDEKIDDRTIIDLRKRLSGEVIRLYHLENVTLRCRNKRITLVESIVTCTRLIDESRKGSVKLTLNTFNALFQGTYFDVPLSQLKNQNHNVKSQKRTSSSPTNGNERDKRQKANISLGTVHENESVMSVDERMEINVNDFNDLCDRVYLVHQTNTELFDRFEKATESIIRLNATVEEQNKALSWMRTKMSTIDKIEKDVDNLRNLYVNDIPRPYKALAEHFGVIMTGIEEVKAKLDANQTVFTAEDVKKTILRLLFQLKKWTPHARL